jgi:hypothetical protein
VHWATCRECKREKIEAFFNEKMIKYTHVLHKKEKYKCQPLQINYRARISSNV